MISQRFWVRPTITILGLYQYFYYCIIKKLIIITDRDHARAHVIIRLEIEVGQSVAEPQSFITEDGWVDLDSYLVNYKDRLTDRYKQTDRKLESRDLEINMKFDGLEFFFFSFFFFFLSFFFFFFFFTHENRGGVIFSLQFVRVSVCVSDVPCEQNSSQTNEPIWTQFSSNGCLLHRESELDGR